MSDTTENPPGTQTPLFASYLVFSDCSRRRRMDQRSSSQKYVLPQGERPRPFVDPRTSLIFTFLRIIEALFYFQGSYLHSPLRLLIQAMSSMRSRRRSKKKRRVRARSMLLKRLLVFLLHHYLWLSFCIPSQEQDGQDHQDHQGLGEESFPSDRYGQ